LKELAMADGQIVSISFGSHRHTLHPGGLLRKPRTLPGAEPASGTSFAALLARNAMLKKALDQERAASANMRRILLGQTGEPTMVRDATTSGTASTTAEDPVHSTQIAASSAQATATTQTPQHDFGFGLTKRQHEVLGLVLAGHPSKNIACDLGISRRTVESHRAAIMQRTGATSLPALARLAIGAEVGGDCKGLVDT
jgi:DNA-binding CsgD family transcriptional regulator